MENIELKPNNKSQKTELSEIFIFQQNLDKKLDTIYDFTYLSKKLS